MGILQIQKEILLEVKWTIVMNFEFNKKMIYKKHHTIENIVFLDNIKSIQPVDNRQAN